MRCLLLKVVTDCFVFFVRFFGGGLLGVKGLRRTALTHPKVCSLISCQEQNMNQIKTFILLEC